MSPSERVGVEGSEVPSLATTVGTALLATLAIGFIGLLDYFTGHDLPLTLVYLAPVLWATWRHGPVVGVLLGLLSVVVRDEAHEAAGRVMPEIFVLSWEMVTAWALFAASVILLHRAKQSYERERLAASTDFLTGAYNRRMMYQLVEREILRAQRNGRPFSILVFDCDDLKRVNDQQGHAAGDRMLRSVAHAVRAELRVTDPLARMGGDEFALLLPETEERGAIEVHQRIRASLAHLEPPATISLGGVTVRTPIDVDGLFHAADQRMYAAKRQGKDRACFEG